MFSYFEVRETTYCDVFCLNFSIETKIKTLFLISNFNLSKQRNGTLGTNRVRVPKVPFRFFDKLKFEIRNKVLIFASILNLRQKTSVVFRFLKLLNIEIQIWSFFFVFHFNLKNEKPNLLKKISYETSYHSPYVIIMNKYKRIK